jgi:hypothetical protein
MAAAGRLSEAAGPACPWAGGYPICALIFRTVVDSAPQGLSMASRGGAFLASAKSSPAVDGDDG